jgi:hypothetical protein
MYRHDVIVIALYSYTFCTALLYVAIGSVVRNRTSYACKDALRAHCFLRMCWLGSDSSFRADSHSVAWSSPGSTGTIASDCHGVARCVCVTRVTQLTKMKKRFFVDETVFGINPLDNTAQGARSREGINKVSSVTLQLSHNAVQRGNNNFGADHCGFLVFLCCTSATQA